jgi:hypothetical protein
VLDALFVKVAFGRSEEAEEKLADVCLPMDF